jgi:hypothetical protein
MQRNQKIVKMSKKKLKKEKERRRIHNSKVASFSLEERGIKI